MPESQGQEMQSAVKTEPATKPEAGLTQDGDSSPPAEHVLSDVDPSQSPKSNSPNADSKKGGKPNNRRRTASAKVAALLADPTSLLELESVDDRTKKTQCNIPFQRSTFLVADETKKEPKAPTKNTYRYEAWNFMEKNQITPTPRSAAKRIPNFKESDAACEKLAELDLFKNAKTVVIGPDRPQQKLRYLALKEGKTLLLPTSRSETGIFHKINPPKEATDEQIALCATSEGEKTFSTTWPLDDEVKVDLVVLGSVAVSRNGQRLGKGQGFADLEWGMMAATGAVNASTVVLTCVHDCQVKDELPENLFAEHDLTVDGIVTPTQTLMIEKPLKKPTGVYWSILLERKFEKVPALKLIREKEQGKGVDVTLKPAEVNDSVSYVSAENQTEKSCQTLTKRGPRTTSTSVKGRLTKGGRRQTTSNNERRGPRNDKRRNNSDRRREKSTTEEDLIEETHKASPGSGDAPNMKRRQKNRNNKRAPKKRDGTETEGDTVEKEVEAGAEGERPRRRRQRPRRNNNQDDNEENEMDEGEERQGGGRGGGRRGGYRGGRGGGYGYASGPPPPWAYHYDGYYGPPPPPPARGGGRYGYRGYGPPPAGPMGGPPPRGPPMRQERGPPAPRNEFTPGPGMKPAVFVGDIPEGCQQGMFQDVLRDRKVKVADMIWQRNANRTFLVFNHIHDAYDCVKKLENLFIDDEECRVDLSNMTKKYLKEQAY